MRNLYHHKIHQKTREKFDYSPGSFGKSYLAPILNILVLQTGHTARAAGLPFFIVTLSNASATSLLARHLTQYIIILLSPPFAYFEVQISYLRFNNHHNANSEPTASIDITLVFVKSCFKKWSSLSVFFSVLSFSWSATPLKSIS